MTKTLGDRIRELRDGADLSLRELAKKLGDVSAAHLSDIELGRRFPSLELLSKIADCFDVSIEGLQKYDHRPPMDEIKRRADRDPTFGFALRKLVDKEVSQRDVLDFAKRKSRQDQNR
jgi:transcriptional regulator with XRE-family HTH domain